MLNFRPIVASLLVLLGVAGTAAEPDTKPVDLLKMINLNRHVVKGRFVAHRRALVSDASQTCMLQVPYIPPEEYDIELDAERLRGTDNIQIAAPIGGNQPALVIDAMGSTISGIWRLDGQYGERNEATFRGHVFPDTGSITVVFRVRRDGVTVIADGKTIIAWKGKPERLSFNSFQEFPDKRTIGLGTVNTCFRISRMELTPVTGEGERLK